MQEGQPSTLCVASLNCECLRDGTQLAASVYAAVKEHGFGRLDVLALQEVSTVRRKHLHAFAADLGMRVVVLSEPDVEVGLANALLIRDDGLQVTKGNSWTLKCRREDRTAVAMELPTVGLLVCCTHLDHKEERVRLDQLEQLHAHLSRESPGRKLSFPR